jgi:hypothetical protein
MDGQDHYRSHHDTNTDGPTDVFSYQNRAVTPQNHSNQRSHKANGPHGDVKIKFNLDLTKGTFEKQFHINSSKARLQSATKTPKDTRQGYQAIINTVNTIHL